MKKGAIIFLTGVLAFSSLPSIAADSPSVQVGFSPEGSAQTLVIGAIDSAQSSIRMMAYSFTAMDIMQALVKAKNRGVDVKIVIGVVCGRGRNPTLRLWPAIFSGEIDVFPSERRNMGQEIGR